MRLIGIEVLNICPELQFAALPYTSIYEITMHSTAHFTMLHTTLNCPHTATSLAVSVISSLAPPLASRLANGLICMKFLFNKFKL